MLKRLKAIVNARNPQVSECPFSGIIISPPSKFFLPSNGQARLGLQYSIEEPSNVSQIDARIPRIGIGAQLPGGGQFPYIANPNFAGKKSTCNLGLQYKV